MLYLLMGKKLSTLLGIRLKDAMEISQKVSAEKIDTLALKISQNFTSLPVALSTFAPKIR